jgi:cytochrome c biogenesis protein CcmG, thiol:disulfide interchange protein DsbE
MKRWIAALPLAVLGLLAVLFATFGLHHDPHVAPAALVGKPLPGHPLPPLAGGTPIDLRSTIKGPTVVNVFASWCAPCIEEAPALMAMKAEGARIVGVDYKDQPGRGQGFLDRNGDPFVLVLADRDGGAGLDLGVSGVPETFLVSPSGQIIAKHSGVLTPQDADALLRTAAASR